MDSRYTKHEELEERGKGLSSIQDLPWLLKNTRGVPIVTVELLHRALVSV